MDLSEHWDYILEVARQRLRNNRTARHVEKYGTAIEVRGAAAEVAARLYLGLEPELHTGFDGGYDFLYAGKKVDVKSTKLLNTLQFRNLQWAIDKPVVPDIILFVAVHLEQRVAAMIGYAFRWEMEQAQINRTRNQPCYEIPIPYLHPVWELQARQSFIDWNEGGRPDEVKNPI